ncbi:ABC transporter permease [Abyssisolibacter fermentans]|uniref:ABC transporter permease n=1 Tax=Abyssisolibacter fermentans TaxID=1766203 RepID=UPI00082E0292|nr:ABC transporter permease [Abyssisolibacter fermentans]
MNKKWIAYPYVLWSLIFIVVPLLLIIVFSITYGNKQNIVDLKPTLTNFMKFFDPIYIKVLYRSLKLAVLTTIICLILGYPMAFILAGLEPKKQRILSLLFLLPMWMNFLLRTYAWLTILNREGIINSIIKMMGFEPMNNLLYNSGAVMMGMVYNFLPFMVLPIYTVLNKMDNNIIEAAQDLGADRLTVFRKIIFPLSLPGIISGITMVFMPAVSTFVISRLLGGGQYMLIGNLIERQFMKVGDWHFGSAISMIMMIIVFISMAILNKYDKDNDGGNILW